MNILFVSKRFRVFGQLDCGAANRSYMFVKALAQIGQVDVVSFCDGSQQSDIKNCRLVWGSNVEENKSIVHRVVKNIRLVLTPWAVSGYYECEKKKQEIVKKIYNEKKYDIVACRYIEDAVSCGLIEFMDKLVVDVDDNLTSVYLREMSTLKKSIWSKPLAMWRYRHAYLMQKRFLQRVKCSFYSNITEPPYCASVYLHNISILKPNYSLITKDTPQRLLIVGWLDYTPNKTGTLFFAKEIFPRIKAKLPEAELRIVGKSKDKDLLNQLNSLEGVVALGYVEDIINEYVNCRAVVVPVFSGSGTSVKFVEGMIMNRPLLSTSMGARGFEKFCFPNEHYLLAETDDVFVENAIILLNSIDVGNKIAHKAYDVVTTNFSHDRFIEIVSDEIRKCFIDIT